ncbi:MAG: class I SAM-dependent methyltransferase, partial [Desulfobulbia bacterium]
DMTFDPVSYKQAVKEEWGSAAIGWHKWIPEINAWSYQATENMLDQAGVRKGCRVVDIAAGDGGQSVVAAERVGKEGEVLATDIAPEFIELANAVAKKLGLPQLKAEVMDAESLNLSDNYFDAAISRLGLMYLPDLSKGLSEIKRVLRKGGKLSAVAFTTSEKTPFFSIPIKLIREKRGLPSPDPGQPGPFSLGTPGVLAEKLASAGFNDVREQVIDAPLQFSSAEECVKWRREASGTMNQMLSGLDDNSKEKLWNEIVDAMKKFETPQGFVSPCELLICSAVK